MNRRRFKARVAGFVRFYGSRLIEATGRFWAFITRSVKTHKRRTYVQRTLFGAIVIGVLFGIAVQGGWSPLTGWVFRDSLRFDSVSLPGSEDRALTTDVTDSMESADDRLTSLTSSSGADTSEMINDINGLGAESTLKDAGDERGLLPVQAGTTPEGGDLAAKLGDDVPDGRQMSVRPEPSLPVVSLSSMQWPLQGEQIREFGWYRHPVFGDWRHSSEVVVVPSQEESPVRAALAGRVRDVVNEGGRWLIRVEHAGGWFTQYQGLAHIEVDSYTLVDAGDVLGYAFPRSNAPGVAFSVLQGDVAVDPRSLIDGEAVPAMAE